MLYTLLTVVPLQGPWKHSAVHDVKPALRMHVVAALRPNRLATAHGTAKPIVVGDQFEGKPWSCDAGLGCVPDSHCVYGQR